MTAIYYDAPSDSVVIQGIDVYQPATLRAAMASDGVTVLVTSIAGRQDYALGWSNVTDAAGNSFQTLNACLAYLGVQFSLRKPVGATAMAIAGTPLGGHKALMFSQDGSGAVVYADPDAEDYAFAGISLAAAAAGEQINTITSGFISEPSWTWEPLQPVYVGASGALTQVVPEEGLFHLLGFAPTQTSLMLAPNPPVYLY